MGLTDYGTRTTTSRPNGSKTTTTKGGEYTTKVVHSPEGKLVKGTVYRGPLGGTHSHCEPTNGYSRGVLRSPVFQGKK